MYSNFITPPDFVDEDYETITVINALSDEIVLLANFCKNANKSYNVYLYNSEMKNEKWLSEAILKSKHIILNDIDPTLEYLCSKETTFYYGTKTYLSPAHKINFIMDFFKLNN
jgi:hypothetical protein